MAYDDVVTETVMNATHPSQVARKLTERTKRQYPGLMIFIIYVANERGEMWIYSVKQHDGKYQVKPFNMNLYPLNKDEVDMVFSMNVPMKNLR